MKKRSPRWLVWAGLLLTISSCNLRDLPTRPFPNPDFPPPGSYATPERTLQTLRAAVQLKARGLRRWMGAFADTTTMPFGYHQFFDPADVALFESQCACTAPADWSTSLEHAFFVFFMNVRPSDGYSLALDPDVANPDPPPTDVRATLHRAYRVIAAAPDGNSAIVIAIGYADLYLARTSDHRWVIIRWQDHVDPAIGVIPVDPEQKTLGRRRLESTY